MPSNIAVIGKTARDRIFLATALEDTQNYKQIRIAEGVGKFLKTIYGIGYNKRVPWERQLEVYDAIYKIDPDVQVDYLLARAQLHKKSLVCDDLRYLSELNKLKNAGWKVIRITSPKGKTRIPGIKHSAAGTIVLNEHFGHSDALSALADYSIWHEDKEKTLETLTKIINSLT